MRFTHLHTHSHYSLLDGLSRIDELVAKAKALIYCLENRADEDAFMHLQAMTLALYRREIRLRSKLQETARQSACEEP